MKTVHEALLLTVCSELLDLCLKIWFIVSTERLVRSQERTDPQLHSCNAMLPNMYDDTEDALSPLPRTGAAAAASAAQGSAASAASASNGCNSGATAAAVAGGGGAAAAASAGA